MHVLITGASGYFGSVLCDHLLRSPQVSRLSVFSRTAPPNGQPLFRPEVGIIGVEEFTAANFRARNIDAIFHLAVGRGSSGKEEIACSLAFTSRLLRTASDAGVKRIFYASSQAVYGLHNYMWEEDGAPAPVTPYGVAKYASELMVSAASEQAVSLRFAKLIGPSRRFRVDPSEIPHVLCQHALERTALVLKHPNQRLDLLDVRDAASACARLLEMKPGTLPDVLNIGSGRQISLGGCAKLIGDVGARDFAAPLHYKIDASAESGTSRDFGMSIERMKSLCGWKPALSLETTVQDIFRYMQACKKSRKE